MQKSREIFKTTFDAGRLPAFTYSTYLFVIRKLFNRIVAPEEKLPYARDYVLVLIKATREDRSVYFKGGKMPAKELLPNAIRIVAELEKQIRDAKEVSQTQT